MRPLLCWLLMMVWVSWAFGQEPLIGPDPVRKRLDDLREASKAGPPPELPLTPSTVPPDFLPTDSKIVEKLLSITTPHLEFREITPREAIDFLIRKAEVLSEPVPRHPEGQSALALEIKPAKEGPVRAPLVEIKMVESALPEKFSLSMKDATMRAVLHGFAEQMKVPMTWLRAPGKGRGPGIILIGPESALRALEAPLAALERGVTEEEARIAKDLWGSARRSFLEAERAWREERRARVAFVSASDRDIIAPKMELAATAIDRLAWLREMETRRIRGWDSDDDFTDEYRPVKDAVAPAGAGDRSFHLLVLKHEHGAEWRVRTWKEMEAHEVLETAWKGQSRNGILSFSEPGGAQGRLVFTGASYVLESEGTLYLLKREPSKDEAAEGE